MCVCDSAIEEQETHPLHTYTAHTHTACTHCTHTLHTHPLHAPTAHTHCTHLIKLLVQVSALTVRPGPFLVAIFLKDLRVQLRHLQGYILTCREEDLKMQFMRKLPQPHIYETVHEYSLVVGAVRWVVTSGGCMIGEHVFS